MADRRCEDALTANGITVDAGIPRGRYGRSGEVASTVRHLLSESGGLIAGQLRQVDGGVVPA